MYTHTRNQSPSRPRFKDKRTLIILASLFQYLSAEVSSPFSVSKSSCWPSFSTASSCYSWRTSSLCLISHVLIKPSPQLLQQRQGCWTLPVCCDLSCFQVWSVTDVSLPDYSSHAGVGHQSIFRTTRVMQTPCLLSVDGIQFALRGEARMRTVRPDLSKDGSVIITLWFANRLFLPVAVGCQFTVGRERFHWR